MSNTRGVLAETENDYLSLSSGFIRVRVARCLSVCIVLCCVVLFVFVSCIVLCCVVCLRSVYCVVLCCLTSFRALCCVVLFVFVPCIVLCCVV